MDVIILAAGYATRLYPLTRDRAKPLLRLGDRPIIDHIVNQIERLDGVDCIHVVTNEKFHRHFQAWAACRAGRRRIRVHNDGTTSNADRLGAIGDIAYVIDHAKIESDLFVVAGDNVFQFDLGDAQAFYRAHGTTAMLYRVADMRLIPKYSEVKLGDNQVITSFVEKPPAPTSNLVGICCYFFQPEHLGMFRRCLEHNERDNDAPGFFMQWLHREAVVHGYEFDGLWYDIGDMGSLTEADNLFRLGLGLPTREIYAL